MKSSFRMQYLILSTLPVDFALMHAELKYENSVYETTFIDNFELWTFGVMTESSGQKPNEEEYVWRRMSSVVEQRT